MREAFFGNAPARQRDLGRCFGSRCPYHGGLKLQACGRVSQAIRRAGYAAAMRLKTPVAETQSHRYRWGFRGKVNAIPG